MKNSTKTIVGIGLLTAIIIVLQLVASTIHFGVFSITLVLAPIIVGAALYGYKAGAWLGFVFGVFVLITDAQVFLAINIPGTIITCILKGVCAGLLAGAVYLALSKKNKLLAVICAGIAAPVANTGVFLIGCCLFFLDTIKGWAGDTNVGIYMLTGFVGINFIVELAINLVLSAVIVQIINIGKKSLANS
ncbi:MAG: ECF transporter S component [Agathobacter sp.]